MYVPCIQWLPKPLYKVQGPMSISNTSRWQAFSFGASRHVYSHHNTACRIGTHLKSTTLYRSCIHLCRSMHQNCRLPLCCIVMGNRKNGRHSDCPRWWKRRLAVLADTGGIAYMAISSLTVRDVVLWFWYSTVYLETEYKSKIFIQFTHFSKNTNHSLSFKINVTTRFFWNLFKSVFLFNKQ